MVDLERDEVTLVHPDQRRTDREGPFELGLVVHLDERVETDFDARARESARELDVREGGRDQQHRVSAHRARVADIASVDREVLAEHRQVASRREP